MAMPSIFSSRSSPWVIVVLAVVGCDDGPRMVQVSGVVTLDGAPLADAAVALYPQQEGPMAGANSDAQGRIVFATADRQGVIPGRYRATVIKFESLGYDINKPDDYTNVTEKWYTPKRYSQVESSGLEYEISDTSSDLKIELKSG
jgi:hypothetical protein